MSLTSVIFRKYDNGDIVAIFPYEIASNSPSFCLSRMANLDSFYCEKLYPYANDDHIYTALKSICPTVTKRY